MNEHDGIEQPCNNGLLFLIPHEAFFAEHSLNQLRIIDSESAVSVLLTSIEFSVRAPTYAVPTNLVLMRLHALSSGQDPLILEGNDHSMFEPQNLLNESQRDQIASIDIQNGRFRGKMTNRSTEDSAKSVDELDAASVDSDEEFRLLDEQVAAQVLTEKRK